MMGLQVGSSPSGRQSGMVASKNFAPIFDQVRWKPEKQDGGLSSNATFSGPKLKLLMMKPGLKQAPRPDLFF